MSTLSDQEEHRVIAAVKRATALVDDAGMSPNDALTKVARENSWGVNMVKFAARAYNSGRQIAQMRTGKTASEKYADFDVMDPAVAISALTSRRPVKTAVDATVAVGPMWLDARKVAADSTQYVGHGYDFKKQERSLNNNGAWDTDVPVGANDMAGATKRAGDAGIFANTITPEDHPGLAPGAVAEYKAAHAVADAFDTNRRLKTALEDATSEVYVKHTKLANALQILADHMKGDGFNAPPRFCDVEFVCQTYLGKKAESVLAWVASNNKTPKETRASVSRGLRYDPDAMPYSMINKCIKLAGEYVAADQAKTDAEVRLTAHVKKAAEVLTPAIVDEKFNLLTGTTRTVTYDDAKLAFMLPIQPVAEPEPVKEASIFSNISPAVVTNGTRVLFDKAFETAKGNNPLSGRALKYLSSVSDPVQDGKLRQIRAMTDMSEIMNDPVISSEDPAKVTNIYNNIARMSPRATEQPMVMIPQIRRHLQGQVEPFEADNLLNTEANLAKAHPSPAHVQDPSKVLNQFKGQSPSPAAK